MSPNEYIKVILLVKVSAWLIKIFPDVIRVGEVNIKLLLLIIFPTYIFFLSSERLQNFEETKSLLVNNGVLSLHVCASLKILLKA